METKTRKKVKEVDLSPRRTEALALFRKHGYDATVKVAEEMGVTPNAAYQYRRYLEDARLISRRDTGTVSTLAGTEPETGNGNGHGTAADQIRDLVANAVGVASQRMKEIDIRREEIADSMSKLNREDEALASEEEHLAVTSKSLEVNVTAS